MAEQNSDTFDAKLDRITEQVDAITGFVGRSAELQMQTQMRLDRLTESIDTLTASIHE